MSTPISTTITAATMRSTPGIWRHPGVDLGIGRKLLVDARIEALEIALHGVEAFELHASENGLSSET